MSAEEEVEEHVQHARNPFDKTVAGTMAITAALLAVVSVLGQHFNTEKLLNQQFASDQWAYYQAKDIRRYTSQVAQDTLHGLKADAGTVKKYADDEHKYKNQAAAIQDKAHEFEKERDKVGTKADYFHIGEIFLELSIVFSSLSILMKVRPLFLAGAAAAIVGIVISIVAWWA